MAGKMKPKYSRINGAGQFVVPLEEVRKNQAVQTLIEKIQERVPQRDQQKKKMHDEAKKD